MSTDTIRRPDLRRGDWSAIGTGVEPPAGVNCFMLPGHVIFLLGPSVVLDLDYLPSSLLRGVAVIRERSHCEELSSRLVIM